jgi:arylsulfatase A-like enzyme
MALVAVPATASQQPNRPNILMILADDLGVNDLGEYSGNTQIDTPNLDRLVREGVSFTRHYTAGDVCAPTRASLVTGLYPQRLQFRIGQRGISPEVVTLADLFRSAGYDTHHVGKWHLGHELAEVRPLAQGYDTFFGFLHARFLKQPLEDALPSPSPTYNTPYLVAGERMPRQYPGHLTDLITERAVHLIKESAPRGPWLMTLWYLAPHVPLEPPERWRVRYPNTLEGRYRALVSALDESVGRVLQALEKSGQAEHTMVAFLSDNGGTGATAPSNAPFFGRKNQFFEGGVRTPFILWSPKRLPPRRVQTTVSSLDVYPTLAALAALEIPYPVDGRDLGPLLKGQSVPPQPLFWEAYRVSPGLEFDGLSLDFAALDATGRWRRVHQDGTDYLFDLHADPSGSDNVLAAHPKLAQTLENAYRAWHQRMRLIPVHIQPQLGATWQGEALELQAEDYALATGQAIQRTPGQAGFSFAVGIEPKSTARATQLIASQPGAWRLQREPDGSLRLQMADGLLRWVPKGAVTSCTSVVVTAHFFQPMLGSKESRTYVDLFVNGVRRTSTRSQGGVENRATFQPTFLGGAPGEKAGFAGRLWHPKFFNLRLSAKDVKALSHKLCPVEENNTP